MQTLSHQLNLGAISFNMGSHGYDPSGLQSIAPGSGGGRGSGGCSITHGRIGRL